MRNLECGSLADNLEAFRISLYCVGVGESDEGLRAIRRIRDHLQSKQDSKAASCLLKQIDSVLSTVQ